MAKIVFFFSKIWLTGNVKAFATFHNLLWCFGFADKGIKANQVQKAIHFTIHVISTKLQQEQSRLAIR